MPPSDSPKRSEDDGSSHDCKPVDIRDMPSLGESQGENVFTETARVRDEEMAKGVENLHNTAGVPKEISSGVSSTVFTSRTDRPWFPSNAYTVNTNNCVHI